MPTRRPRHTITETPAVERALRRLRDLDPEGVIDLEELVVLGAERKAEDLGRHGDAGRRRSLELDAFVELRADEHLDAEAGLELHETGWAPDR